MNSVQLSICIATFNRGAYIGETLDSILCQLGSNVEIVVVDGCSPDNTSEVMFEYGSRYPQISYYREKVNSGVDGDYDKAVSYAQGEYCWLMTDDDLLCPGAIETVLSEISNPVDLLVVDAEIRNADFSRLLEKSRLGYKTNRQYGKNQQEQWFSDLADHLSFIGCVIIRRECWLGRNRAEYYGTVFIHIGVVFQHPPLETVRVVSEPLVVIRYGNAMWTSRAFDIWMFKWPELIWGFPDYSDEAKQSICQREPWKKAKTLFEYRAKGAYSISEFRKYFNKEKSSLLRCLLYVIAVFPSRLANFLSVIYVLKNRSRLLTIYELSLSKNASLLSRYYCRITDR